MHTAYRQGIELIRLGSLRLGSYPLIHYAAQIAWLIVGGHLAVIRAGPRRVGLHVADSIGSALNPLLLQIGQARRLGIGIGWGLFGVVLKYPALGSLNPLSAIILIPFSL